VRAERAGDSAITVGNLSARRDFTDVRDIVRAYRLLVERGAPGEVYNVCSGRDLAIQYLADHLVSLASRPIELRPDPELMRPADLPVLRGDASKLTAATGWTPEIPIEQTLADLVDDLRTRA
jgi:GDP-4-dehydro-6-deoxy-D-mannose reductase